MILSPEKRKILVDSENSLKLKEKRSIKNFDKKEIIKELNRRRRENNARKRKNKKMKKGNKREQKEKQNKLKGKPLKKIRRPKRTLVVVMRMPRTKVLKKAKLHLRSKSLR